MDLGLIIIIQKLQNVYRNLIFSGLSAEEDGGNKKLKCVKFADGIAPGEGTSPSGGEELSSPPPPKEKRSKKIKKKKLQKKKKIKVRHLQCSFQIMLRIEINNQQMCVWASTI